MVEVWYRGKQYLWLLSDEAAGLGVVWRRVRSSWEAGGSNSFMRKERGKVRENWEQGSLQWVEGFGELQLCDRRAV